MRKAKNQRMAIRDADRTDPGSAFSLGWNGRQPNTIFASHNQSVAMVYGIPLHVEMEDVAVDPRFAGALETARLLTAAPRLFDELRHQLRNCPLCKGDRKHESITDIMFGKPPGRIVPCGRCESGWNAIAAALGMDETKLDDDGFD